ncbi:MAG: CRISPR-associated protein Cas4 [Bacteroidia bacterium]|nr:CRISPR-associated protein Cas4 [Bacteroidia bacterium]
MEFADIQAWRITGTKVHYFLVCHRKLWLFSRHITMERGHGLVEEGRLLHRDAYERSLRKEQWLGGLVRLDHTEGGLLVEIKRSRRLPRVARYQLLFYLYLLKKYVGWSEGEAFPIAGEIRYPRERRKERVELTPQAEAEVEKVIEGIRSVEELPHPPVVPYKGLCKRCAYAELCWG